MATLVNKGQVGEKKEAKRELKRLFFDIETSPNLVYSWNVGYDIKLDYDNIVKERAIMTICYKWQGNPKVYSLKWSNGDDKQMLKDFVKVMHESDETIGHNSIQFDTKWIRTRCIYHGIPMMPEFTAIDTLRVCRSKFRFNSNRLDYVSKFLGVGQKVKTGGFGLWKAVMDGSRIAMNKMVTYCKNDVVILEKVFNKLNKYTLAKTHIGVLKGQPRHSCPECGSVHSQKRGISITATGGKKQRLQCQSAKCGKYYSINLSN